MSVSLTATDLYGSRRAGRATEDPGARGKGKDWSTGCSGEEGNLERINMQIKEIIL